MFSPDTMLYFISFLELFNASSFMQLLLTVYLSEWKETLREIIYEVKGGR